MDKKKIRDIALKAGVAGVVALMWILLCFGGDDKESGTKLADDIPEKVEDDSVTLAPYEVVADVSKSKTWSYREMKDEMTDGINKWAYLRSDNYVNMKFPYSGGAGATLAVRKAASYGTDVYIKIDQGQIYGRTNSLRIRFDDNAAVKYRYKEAADGSTDIVFLSNAKGFIEKAKKAKTIKVELPLYQEGYNVFEFSVDSSLVW